MEACSVSHVDAPATLGPVPANTLVKSAGLIRYVNVSSVDPTYAIHMAIRDDRVFWTHVLLPFYWEGARPRIVNRAPRPLKTGNEAIPTNLVRRYAKRSRLSSIATPISRAMNSSSNSVSCLTGMVATNIETDAESGHGISDT